MAGKESRRPQARDTGLVGNNSAPIRALAGMASLRLGVAGWIGLAGPWLTSAWTIGGALVLLDRMWLGFAAPAWILVATPVVVAALVTAVMAWVRTPSRLVALSLVDSRLGLHDALASGAALSAEANEDAFAQLAVHDAAAQAAQVRLRAGAPVQLTNWWGVWPIAAIAATAIVVWTPDAAAQRRERVEEQRLTQEQASQQARNAIAAAATAVVSDEDVADNAAAPAVDSADGQDARFLKRLEEELSTGDVTPDEARTQAAKRVQKTAQRSAKQAAQGGALTEALSRRFSGLQSSEKNMNNMDSSEMQALREALARGDARQAAESIRLLEEKLAKVDDATRHQIADEISRLSKQLEEQSATATDKTPAQSTTDPTAPLRDAGLSKDEAKQLLEETQDADQLRDALRQRGVDEPTASKAAQQAEDLEQRRDMDRQAEKTHDEVKKALDGASRKMREQPESAQRDNSRQDGAAKPSDATKPSDESAQDENAQDERESASRTAKPADSRRKTDESNESARQTHGAKRPGQTQGEPKRISTQRSPAPGQPGAPSDAKQEEGAQQAVDSPESKPGAKAGESQDNRGSTSAPQAERNKGQDTQGETPAAVKEENPDEKSVKDGADMQRNADEHDQAKDDSMGKRSLPDHLPSAKELERARKALEKLGKKQADSEKARERAKRLEEQARKLLEGMNPQERERLRKWAESLAREHERELGGRERQPQLQTGEHGSGPSLGPTQRLADSQRATNDDGPRKEAVVDARRKGARQQGSEGGQIVGELLRDDKRNGQASSHSALSQAVDRASKQADRALEERTIPARRRDAVKRYFDRLRKLARDRSKQKTPAPAAPDAPTKKHTGDGL